jgi:hypothetical protein
MDDGEAFGRADLGVELANHIALRTIVAYFRASER